MNKDNTKNNRVCLMIFTVYVILTFIGAANHELWFDEAQAWNIARDNDFEGMFRQLVYEGHPPLWYIILYFPAHAGLPCSVIPFISWFITAVAGALIMFRSPLNTVTNTAVLLSGGFLFVNSILSRSYCLINLILVLIAIVYPKRKKYSVLYGLLIALLANTHLLICGFVGILGIFMLIDFFSGFGQKTLKQKTKEFFGLAIAGIGVLILIIPLIRSLSLNSEISFEFKGLKSFFVSFTECFIDTAKMVLIYYNTYNGIIYVLSMLTSYLFIIGLILIKNKTRPFFMLLTFYIFYTITSDFVWFVNSNRAFIFLYMYFIIAWIAEYEPQNNTVKKWSEIENKINSDLIKKIINKIENVDINFRKIYITITTVLLFVTFPCGAYYLFSDYTKAFTSKENVAEYIKNNLPSDSIIVEDNDEIIEVSAYLPNYKFYSLSDGDFFTYTKHSADSKDASIESVYNFLKKYDNVYLMSMYGGQSEPDYAGKVIYQIPDNMLFWRRKDNYTIEISEFDLDAWYYEKMHDNSMEG